uniref:AP2 domain containing protein, putative n=1 Tax=Theileria annulata TaxID=5874 RepID=A0A3B0NAU9_THEAN
MNSNTMSPTAGSDVVREGTTVDNKDDCLASVPDTKPSEGFKESGTVYHRQSDSALPSLSSLETQATLQYNSSLPHSKSIDYSYDHDKKPLYSPLYNVQNPYENDQYLGSVDPSKLVQQSSIDSQSSQSLNFAKQTPEDQEKFQRDLQDPNGKKQADPVTNYLNPVYCPEGLVQPQNKVVAVNPVILVDKVERSLIVQWYENSVKREQRISYKKYGNAKAQQRAEGLISKLLAGSTFDQLYPEKGPPILTIFENVGKSMVSLTRDRIIREWRVDWLNSNGSKMRARWSCKKVGNEEARKRAETFAYSLIQGTFNPRLLHKATGTRLSKNDMKYNAVVSGLDSQMDSKAINQLSESNWQSSEGTTKRRTKKRSVKSSDQKKGRSRKRNLSTYTDVNASNTLSTANLSSNLLSTGASTNTPLATNTLSANLSNTFNANSNPNSDMPQYMNSHCYPYMNMVQDPSFSTNPPSFYPMYQEECESSTSVNQQLDPNSAYATSMLQQNWMDWTNSNNMQKVMPYGQEWDYTANSAMVDYPFYPQQANSGLQGPNTNMSSNMTWDPLNNYTNLNMYIHQNELQTGREFEEQTDSRMANQYFGYYGGDQSFGFQENILNQDQMMMGCYYNYPNTMRMDANPQWPEENKDYTKFNKDFNVEYNKDYNEDVKNEEPNSEKNMSQVTTLANYKNITGTSICNELPPQNLSVSTRMYTTDHYGYVNSDLGDVKQEDSTLNYFSNELEDPLLQSQGMPSHPLNIKKSECSVYQKDKFQESYDSVTYREAEDPVKYYNM